MSQKIYSMLKHRTPENEERHQKLLQEVSQNETKELFFFNDEDMLYFVQKDIGYILNVAIYKKRPDCVFRYYVSPYENIYVHIPLELETIKGKLRKVVNIPTRDGDKKYLHSYVVKHSYEYEKIPSQF